MAGKKAKILKNVAYNLGASIVIIGALFKLTHWPGADVMLVVGLGTEAFLFFIGCFEALPPDDVDWSVVFPDLKDSHGKKKKKKKEIEEPAPKANGGLPFTMADMDPDAMNQLAEGITRLNATANNIADLTDATIVTQNYVENIGRASESAGNMAYAGNQTAEALSAASEGMVQSYAKASDSVNNIAQANVNSAEAINNSTQNLASAYHQIAGTVEGSAAELNSSIKNVATSVGEATNNLAGSINNASQYVDNSSKELADNVKNVSDVVVNSAQNIADAYQKTAEMMVDSNSKIISGYEELSTKIVSSFEGVADKSNGYIAEIETMNKNLSALNSAYDFQVQHSNQQLEIQKEMQGKYKEVLDSMSETIDNTNAYKSHVNELTNKVQALNDIYGGMLSVMNNKN